MDNNISGSSSSDSFPRTTSITDSSRFPSSLEDKTTPKGKTVLRTDAQVFEGIDFINNADIIIQEFSTTQQPGHQGLYKGSSQNPILPMPDPEGQTGPQPFEPVWRRAVNKDFMQQLRLVLMKKEGQSSSQIETHINTIIQMITSGQTATLSAEDKNAVGEAAKQVQTRWKLPTSWSPGTKEIKDWTPIAKEVDPPVNVEFSRKEFITNNLLELVTALDKAAERVANTLPPNDPQRLGIGDVAKILGKAIQDLKAVLQDMQLKDYDIASKAFEGKKDAIKDRDIELSNITDKMKEAVDARKEQEKTAKIMKIVAPIISAIVIIIGVAALPFTAGASSALIIAGVAVASVMLTYTALDSAFNITSKAVEGFNKWLEATFPGDSANATTARSVIKALILTALVVILVVAVAATGGGAAANVATATTAQIIKQAVIETIRQLAVQFTIIAIMSSNIIPDLIVQILLSSGAVNKNDQQTLMILKMVIAILSMIVIMFAVSKASQRTTGTENVGKTEAKSVEETVKLSEKIKEFINDGIKSIKAAPSNLKEAGKEFLANLDPKNIKEGFKSYIKDARSLPELPSKIQDFFKVVGLSIEIGTGIYLAHLGFKLAKVYEETGEIQKAQELIKMLIKLLDQLLASFQDGINVRSEWLANLDGAINSLYASAQNSINKATQYAA